MKRIIFGICCVVTLFISLLSCNEERITYSDGNFVMFSDTLNVLPIQNNTEVFDIAITATKSYAVDRNFGVEIIDKKSNAIEGKHYSLESATVTIKAGENRAFLTVRGLYDNIGINDSIGFTVRLVSPDNFVWDAYDERWTESQIVLRKTCPFDINAFSGYATLQSSYFESYMNGVNVRLIKIETNEQNNTLTLKNMLYKGHDLTVNLDTEDPLRPDLYMSKNQRVGRTDEAFGTIYGNGDLMCYMPTAYLSYYSTCEQFMIMYLTFYVDGVGTVGTFTNIVKCISDEEAEVLISQGIDR